MTSTSTWHTRAGTRFSLSRRGDTITPVTTVAGGVNGIHVDPKRRTMTGADCWRVDGTPWRSPTALPAKEFVFNPK